MTSRRSKGLVVRAANLCAIIAGLGDALWLYAWVRSFGPYQYLLVEFSESLAHLTILLSTVCGLLFSWCVWKSALDDRRLRRWVTFDRWFFALHVLLMIALVAYASYNYRPSRLASL